MQALEPPEGVVAVGGDWRYAEFAEGGFVARVELGVRFGQALKEASELATFAMDEVYRVVQALRPPALELERRGGRQGGRRRGHDTQASPSGRVRPLMPRCSPHYEVVGALAFVALFACERGSTETRDAASPERLSYHPGRSLSVRLCECRECFDASCCGGDIVKV